MMPRLVRIEVLLKKEERRATIHVKGDTKEAALKDPDLIMMTKAGWKASKASLIVDDKEVLELIKSRKKIGISTDDLAAEFRGVDPSELFRALGALRNMGEDATAEEPFIHHVRTEGGMRLNYVATEFVKAALADQSSKDMKQRESAGGSRPASFSAPTPPPDAKPKDPEMSKAEGKRHRKTIIEKAQAADLMADGFRQGFVDALSDLERQYLRSLERFHIKLMIAEIKKKPQASSNAS